MSDKRMKKQRVIYCGRRLSSDGKLLDTFAREGELDDLLYYKAKRRCEWAIGNIYAVKLSDGGTLDFGSFKVDPDNTASDKQIVEWATQDASARRAKSNESARVKLQKERRDEWMRRLDPLRCQYRQMSSPQRRAMRQLVLEWLES